jgi:hypothetical protein
MDENSHFRKLLDTYREMYVQFATTGSQQYKDAYEKVMEQITQAIDDRKKHSETESQTLSAFLSEYTNDLNSLTPERVQEVSDKAAAASERYKQLAVTSSSAPIASDTGSAILLRFGILLILLPLFFLLGFYYPGGFGGMFGDSQYSLQMAANAAGRAAASVYSPRFGPMGSPRFGPFGSP